MKGDQTSVDLVYTMSKVIYRLQFILKSIILPKNGKQQCVNDAIISRIDGARVWTWIDSRAEEGFDCGNYVND